jgi:hypothetical protein
MVSAPLPSPTRLPKPLADEVRACFRLESASLHDCPLLRRRTPEVERATAGSSPERVRDVVRFATESSGARMAEALLLATRLVPHRAALGRVGEGPRFGALGLRGQLCPHGIPTSAHDLAELLRDAWGRPSASWSGAADNLERARELLAERKGVVFFDGIAGVEGWAHLDLWWDADVVGHAAWACHCVAFWQLFGI